MDKETDPSPVPAVLKDNGYVSVDSKKAKEGEPTEVKKTLGDEDETKNSIGEVGSIIDREFLQSLKTNLFPKEEISDQMADIVVKQKEVVSKLTASEESPANINAMEELKATMGQLDASLENFLSMKKEMYSLQEKVATLTVKANRIADFVKNMMEKEEPLVAHLEEFGIMLPEDEDDED